MSTFIDITLAAIGLYCAAMWIYVAQASWRIYPDIADEDLDRVHGYTYHFGICLILCLIGLKL